MQPTVESLQGQLLALRGFVASLIEVMPLHTRVQFAAKLDRNLELLRPTRAGDLLEGFGREMEALVVKRRCVPGRDQGEAPGAELRSQPRSG